MHSESVIYGGYFLANRDAPTRCTATDCLVFFNIEVYNVIIGIKLLPLAICWNPRCPGKITSSRTRVSIPQGQALFLNKCKLANCMAKNVTGDLITIKPQAFLAVICTTNKRVWYMCLPTCYTNYTLQFWKNGSKSPASPEMGKRNCRSIAKKQGYCAFCENTKL